MLRVVSFIKLIVFVQLSTFSIISFSKCDDGGVVLFESGTSTFSYSELIKLKNNEKLDKTNLCLRAQGVILYDNINSVKSFWNSCEHMGDMDRFFTVALSKVEVKMSSGGIETINCWD